MRLNETSAITADDAPKRGQTYFRLGEKGQNYAGLAENKSVPFSAADHGRERRGQNISDLSGGGGLPRFA
jgi:hypothetical protein